ncbi:hypothetical protein Glove_24g22 [Diversispora epigaea]|uniref:Uncharacterized protein n=1 Tax=Diversispora epigaea TaxID=1348612 RepID=A0A397JSV4_9GLOM|nr:hypothetical protein Glove_24g22 [Diversispora epigaea]
MQVEVLYEMISHLSHSWFTSMIGSFYKNGIGTVTDNQMAFKFFSKVVDEIIDASSTKSPYLMKLYNVNKEIGTILLANMHLIGLGIEKDVKLHFIFIVNLLMKEKGPPVAQRMVDVAKGFPWYMKSAFAGNIYAIWNILKAVKAFEWFMKAAEYNYTYGQYEVGKCFYEGCENPIQKLVLPSKAITLITLINFFVIEEQQFLWFFKIVLIFHKVLIKLIQKKKFEEMYPNGMKRTSFMTRLTNATYLKYRDDLGALCQIWI